MCDLKKWDKKVKKLKTCDISLIKVAVVAFTLLLLSVLPQLNTFLMSIHWGWYLVIAILASYIPMKKFIT